MAAKKSFSFPKRIGTCADRLYKIKAERLAKQKEVDALKAEESALKQHIIDTLPKSNASGVAGKLARVTVVTKEEPQVVDQAKFRQYLNRTKRFDLAYKLRPSPPAIRELWEEGKEVAGVEKFTVVTVSLNKV
jgi:hypothetical protein